MKPLLRTTVTALAILLLVQTFVTLGVVQPIRVEGVSMAPTLDGARLLVDRTSAAPRRWEVVVARRPDDATRLCVKRVLGMPGERVAFREGDLWINGCRAVKPLPTQQAMRVPVAIDSSTWRSESDAWRRIEQRWESQPTDRPEMLRFTPAVGWPIYDDLPLNANVSRRLQPVADVQLTAAVRLRDTGGVAMAIEQGRSRIVARISRHGAELGRERDGEAVSAKRTKHAVGETLRVTLSSFDATPQLAITGGPTLALAELAPRPVTGLAIAAEAGSRVGVADLQVWRDVYYEADPRRGARDSAAPWRLGRADYFLVGDNQAVSLDSRTWRPAAGVPRRLLVGRVGLAW